MGAGPGEPVSLLDAMQADYLAQAILLRKHHDSFNASCHDAYQSCLCHALQQNLQLFHPKLYHNQILTGMGMTSKLCTSCKLITLRDSVEVEHALY